MREFSAKNRRWLAIACRVTTLYFENSEFHRNSLRLHSYHAYSHDGRHSWEQMSFNLILLIRMQNLRNLLLANHACELLIVLRCGVEVSVTAKLKSTIPLRLKLICIQLYLRQFREKVSRNLPSRLVSALTFISTSKGHTLHKKQKFF